METKTDTTAAQTAAQTSTPPSHPDRAELAANFRRLAILMREGAEVMASWENVAKLSDATRLDELNVLGAVSSHLHSCLARVHNVAVTRLVATNGEGELLTANEVIDLRVLSFVAQGTFRDQGVVELGPDPLAERAACTPTAEALS